MAIVLENALLTDLDPPRVETGSLRIENGRIAERGERVTRQPADECVDCGGAVVLPGLVNGHAHLYSALATGMPAPPQTPTNFVEILQSIWWRLDRALDADAIRTSARIGALDALRCGTTTLIDHHASPSCIAGSLGLLEEGLAEVGLRGVLCYETTDRNGPAGRDAGLAENRRYLEKMKARPNGRFAALVGAHALFTLADDTLAGLAQLADEFDTGIHIHVAEDPADDARCRSEHGAALIDRLTAYDLLRRTSILAHGTHLDADAIARVNEVGPTIAHNPRSNMNNGVGYTPIAAYRCPVMLGTDGIGSDMFSEARHAWFKARDAHADLSLDAILSMLATSARRAATALGATLGKLGSGAAADVVITDYRPATPLTGDNLAGHFLYAMGSNHVASVLIGGRWVLRDRKVQTCDETDIRRQAADAARAVWRRIAEIG